MTVSKFIFNLIPFGTIQKAIRLAFLAVFLNSPGLFAQNITNNSMSLDKIVGNKTEALKFIDSEMISYDLPLSDKIKLNHSLLLYQFNKIKVQNRTGNAIFGLPVNSVFAFQKDAENFCIYLLIELDQHDLGIIAQNIGYANNVTQDDYQNGDFDFLSWHLHDMDAIIIKDRMSSGGQPGKSSFILCLTNMKMKDIVCSEKLFEQ